MTVSHALNVRYAKTLTTALFPILSEIDAASNSKVDDIRELREGVVYTPERCKYKVYIS